MFKTNILKFNSFFLLSILVSGCNRAEIDRIYAEQMERDLAEFIASNGNNYPPPKGKIEDNRYYAPKNVFSCRAEDFGEGKYNHEELLNEAAACVGFHSTSGKSKLAEILFFPGLEEKEIDEKTLKDIFEICAIDRLKNLYSAKGIVILQEEMIEDNMLFVAVAIEEMSVIRGPKGEYLPSTKGYLAFKEEDKIVLLSNQETTFRGQKHLNEQHIEKLKQDILDFRKTFEFGPIPLPEEKAEIAGANRDGIGIMIVR